MKQFVGFCCIFWLFIASIVAQDIPTLLKQTKEEKNPARLADIHNVLASKLLSKDGEKAILHAKSAIKNADLSKNKTVKAEALNTQAKATAGFYYPNKSVPNRRNKSARQYHEAKNLFESSMNLSKSIAYSQLELDNIENLSFLNTKKIGRHSPDKREEVKYYKLYIERLKSIKKVTKPTPTFTVPNTATNGNNQNSGKNSPESSGSEKFVKQLVLEKKELKDKVDDMEGEIKSLEKELDHLNSSLKKALDSGTSSEEIERLKTEQEKVEKDLRDNKYKRKKEKEKFKKEKSKLVEERDAATLSADLAAAQADRIKLGVGLGGIIAALILSFLYFGYRSQSRARKRLADKNEIIAQEQERSEELLLNILPKDIAQELKTSGSAKARRHDNVTVLFSDFKNFTKVAETLSPEGLVKELDYCFKGFDYIISQYPSIEKIKTIGDAYMCCAGLSAEHRYASKDMVNAAMDMQEFLFDYKADRQSKSLPFFEARIGIHTGAVVAGVVGNKKFAYDIWGDTVNVASRMESNGGVGKVNVSADTYNEIRYQFSCHPRGKIQVKNKGLIEMYFVDKAYT